MLSEDIKGLLSITYECAKKFEKETGLNPVEHMDEYEDWVCGKSIDRDKSSYYIDRLKEFFKSISKTINVQSIINELDEGSNFNSQRTILVESESKDMLLLVNMLRGKSGCNPLRVCRELEYVAKVEALKCLSRFHCKDTEGTFTSRICNGYSIGIAVISKFSDISLEKVNSILTNSRLVNRCEITHSKYACVSYKDSSTGYIIYLELFK